MAEQARHRSSFFVMLLAGLAGIGASLVCLLIFLPWAQVVFAAVSMIALFGLISGLHYALWGWWLAPFLHDQVDDEDRQAEDAKNRDRFG